MVSIKNVSRTPFTANCLSNVDYGPSLAPVEFNAVFPSHSGAGKATIVKKTLPASISWAPGETKTLPEPVLGIPEVKRVLSLILVVVG